MKSVMLVYNGCMLQRYQWIIFWLLCTVVAFVLFLRILVLLPLYIDADLRSRVGTLIEATANREGWLLSGITINHILDDRIAIEYRSYFRGLDTKQCYYISFTTGSLSACDAS